MKRIKIDAVEDFRLGVDVRWLIVLATVGLFFAHLGLCLVSQAAQVVYYDPTIRDIVNKDCSRCHSGPLRNLMSYDAIKAYADSGMLEAMLNGLMRQFAGSDADTILAWAAAGAPERAPISPQATQQATAAALSTGQKVYFEPTVRDIIVRDCGRCHSGPNRNLTDWDHIRVYVDNGMLAAMLQGPMQRFAGPDADLILAWLNSGAPESQPKAQAQAVQAALLCPPATPGAGVGQFSGQGQGLGRTGNPASQAPVTYTNTIEGLLAKDCMTCHLGPFRKMTTYRDVKMYVDNGLLETLVSPGGQMHRFAGPDTRFFLIWIRSGAPK